MIARAPTSLVWLLAMGLLGLSTGSALAAPAPPDDHQSQAEARFQQGSEAFDRGHIEEACAAFSESLALYETVGTLLNLALCHEAQGKTASAWREFTHAGAEARDPAQRERRDFARQHAQKLEAFLARVVIDVDPDRAQVAIDLDGEPVTDALRGLPLFVDPGDHAIRASAPRRKDFVATIHVPAGRVTAPIVVHLPALEVEPPPTSPPPVPELSSPPPSQGTRRLAGWVLGGVGVVGIGAGAAFAVDALAQMGSCTGSCDPKAAQTAEAISLVSFGAGLASLGTAAWLAWGPGSAPAAASGRVQIVPRVAAHGGALSVIGAW